MVKRTSLGLSKYEVNRDDWRTNWRTAAHNMPICRTLMPIGAGLENRCAS